MVFGTFNNTPSRNRGPILLMFHGTPDAPPSSRYSISANKFKKQLKFLKENNWHTALVKELTSLQDLPPKTIILTFDDGYLDNFDGAFLPLLRYDMRATWFITTDCLGKYAHWMGPPSAETKMLAIPQLKEMVSQGMEIGSHTCSHPDLTRLSAAEQLQEIKKSKVILESLVEEEICSFAYPYGKYNDFSVDAVRQSDYRFACTTRTGWLGSDPNRFLMRRVTIFSTDSVSTLARKLIFADNDVSWKKMAAYYLQRAKSKLIDHSILD